MSGARARGRGCGSSTCPTSTPRWRSSHDAWDAFGALDCLVNNAAVGKRKLVTDHTPEDLDVVMRTNFMSPIRMNLAVLPLMLERGSGTIVNVASGGGRFGIVHESAYCAAKFAMTGWTEVAAMDLADTPDRGEADPTRRHRHRDLDPAARRAPRASRCGVRHRRGVRGGHRRRARDRRLRVLRPRRSQGARRHQEQRPAGLDRPHGEPRARQGTRPAPDLECHRAR